MHLFDANGVSKKISVCEDYQTKFGIFNLRDERLGVPALDSGWDFTFQLALLLNYLVEILDNPDIGLISLDHKNLRLVINQLIIGVPFYCEW